jgi:hypothetical protein
MLRLGLTVFGLGFAAVLIACGGNSDKQATAARAANDTETQTRTADLQKALSTAVATALARAATPVPSVGSSSASASSGSNRASFTVTGAISGTLNFTATACASAGSRSISLSGSMSGTSYGVNIRTDSTGTFGYAAGLAQGTAPLIQFSEQGAASRVWSAGFQQVPGSGTITINGDSSGSIDADLGPSTNTNANIHVKGSWSC